MAKKSYYFKHDYHARHDTKLSELILVMGCEGIGIYWCLIEMLYENDGYLMINKIPIYAKILNTTDEKIQKVLNEFDLFVKKGEKFTSESLIKRLKLLSSKREKASNSARQRWNANAMRTHQKNDANAMLLDKIRRDKIREDKDKNNSFDFSFLNSKEFKEIFFQFETMRAKLKKPMTDHARNLILQKLHRYPIDVAIQMLNQSIVNDWKDVFEPQDYKKKQSVTNQSEEDKKRKEVEDEMRKLDRSFDSLPIEEQKRIEQNIGITGALLRIKIREEMRKRGAV